MTSRRYGLCLLVLLTGCAIREAPPQNFSTPGQALEQSVSAAESGRWSEAISMLDEAIQRFPGEARLAEKRRLLSDEWNRLEALWEDRLAATRARALIDEIERMEPLVIARPERVWSVLQLSQKKRTLRSLRAPLLLCAERRRESETTLAQSCAELGDQVASDVKSRELIAVIDEQINAQAELERERRANAEKSRVTHQINTAEAKLDARDYSGAAATVSRVLRADPDNTRAKAVQQKLEETTSEQNQTLNDIAGRMYAQGEIDAAVRLWEASLRIVPQQPEVRERLGRAMRVLKNLEDLKSQTPSALPAQEEPPEAARDVSTDH